MWGKPTLDSYNICRNIAAMYRRFSQNSQIVSIEIWMLPSSVIAMRAVESVEVSVTWAR